LISKVNGFFRDTSPLFEHSFHVIQLSNESFQEQVIDAKDQVWLVDFYSPWCPHCRRFAPEWENVASYYASSKMMHVGSVDCTQNSQICDQEEVMGYPTIKLFHVPKNATKGLKLTEYSKRNMKGILSWVEDLLKESNMKLDIQQFDLDQQIDAIKNEIEKDHITQEEMKNVNPYTIKLARLRDAGSAATFILEHSFFMGKTILEGERYEAALKWIEAISATFPFEKNRLVFQDLAMIVRKMDAWEHTAWTSMLNKWKQASMDATFPKDLLLSEEENGWVYCKTYTCALWTLLHTMSIGCGEYTTSLKPSEVAEAIRGFVQHFFGCEECVRHFLSANPPSVINTLRSFDEEGNKELVLWLWRMHNKVNKVTKHAFWPSVRACSICFTNGITSPSLDPATLHEDEIVMYLKSIYGYQEQDLAQMLIEYPSMQIFANPLLALCMMGACVIVLYKRINLKETSTFQHKHKA
jgi:thiol oxidase